MVGSDTQASLEIENGYLHSPEGVHKTYRFFYFKVKQCLKLVFKIAKQKVILGDIIVDSLKSVFPGSTLFLKQLSTKPSAYRFKSV